MSHPVLKIALCCIAHPFCPAAQSAIRRELYETYEFEVLGAKNRFATLETIEAALLFAQRHPYSITSALALGRPSLIHDDQYSVQLIGPSDFCSEEEDAPPFEIRHGVDVFVAMALLTHTLSSVISAFYTIRGGQRSLHQSADELYSVCTKIERELDHWRQVYLAPVMADHGFPDVTGLVTNFDFGLFTCSQTIRLYRTGSIHGCNHALQGRVTEVDTTQYPSFRYQTEGI
ncbi:hypothetical protein H2202_007624 [Exophiala xenobiotica]|nr:hypothetical protein H2202_007624 [Exophiala xenobiotica]